MTRSTTRLLCALPALFALGQPASAADPAPAAGETPLALVDLLTVKAVVHFANAKGETGAKEGKVIEFKEYGEAFRLVQLADYSEGREKADLLRWGSKRATEAQWREYEEAFRDVVHAVHKPKPTPAAEKPFDVKSAFPYQKVRLSTEGVKKVEDATAVLFLGSPNKLTAAGVVLAGGLVAFDELNDGKGVTLYSAFPFTNTAVFVPNDPKAFLKNVVNPLSLAKAGVKTADATWGAVQSAVTTAAKKPLDLIAKGAAPITAVTKLPGIPAGIPDIIKHPEIIVKKPEVIIKALNPFHR